MPIKPESDSAWEFVTMQMAQACKLNVPEHKLEKFFKYGSTFLVKRFDRHNGKRIHFASAMTLLGKTDGADALDGSSYLELAEFIMRYSQQFFQVLCRINRNFFTVYRK